MKHIFLIYLILFSIFTISCQKDDPEPPQPVEKWQSLGLANTHVAKIRFSENYIYVATFNGVFRSNINNISANEWQNIGLESKQVQDLIIFNDQEILAAIQLGPEEDISLYRTTDGGNNWVPHQQGFGGEAPATVQALEHDPANPDVLWARGEYVVARSTDRGQSWENVFGEWDLAGYQAPLIKVNPNFPDFIWAGGENAIFQPYLLKSTDRGATWNSVEIPYEGDNAVYDLVSHRDNPEHVLIGMEGQILSSLYGGENWETSISIEDGTYIISMVNHPIQSETIYASGSQGGTSGGNLFYYQSNDFGQTWELHENTEGSGIFFVNDLAVQANGDDLVLYFATDRGVYKSLGE